MHHRNYFFKAIALFAVSFTFFTSVARAQTTPALMQVSVAKDGTTFGLLTDRSIVVLQNKEWKLIEGQLVQISVGGYNNVWGVNQYQNLFRLTSSGWQVQPGGLYTAVSAASDGTAVALNLAGKVLQWTPESNILTPLPGTLTFTKVAIGRRDRIYALTATGEIYKFQSASNIWRQVQGRAKDIAVTFDGIVSVKDFENIPFARTDLDVNLEIDKRILTSETNWQKDYTIAASGISATPISASKFTYIDNSGQPIVVESATLTVDPAPPGTPEIITNAETAPNQAVMVTSSCVSLSGNLTVTPPKDQKPQVIKIVKSNSSCIKGTFKKVVPSGVKTDANQRTLVGQYFSINGNEAEEELEKQHLKEIGTALCGADNKTFGTASAHSYVQFVLPLANPGTTIHLPNGAYNNYVFPTCNRVWWDALTFQCRSGDWALIQGKYGADGLCHGWSGPSPYVKLGNQ